MAAEYSRELSAKTRTAKRGLKALGYWMGGPPGYGLRRQVVRRDGRVLGLRDYGEWKAIQGARVVLVPGPPHELAIVRDIYRMFLDEGTDHGGDQAGPQRAGHSQRTGPRLDRAWGENGADQ
jgi:hypothetical protein